MTSISKIESDVKELSAEVEEAKETLLKRQGRLEELMKRLVNDHGFETIEQAEEHLIEALSNLKKLEEQIERKYTEVNEAIS